MSRKIATALCAAVAVVAPVVATPMITPAVAAESKNSSNPVNELKNSADTNVGKLKTALILIRVPLRMAPPAVSTALPMVRIRA